MTLVHHSERCPPNPLLQAFITWWQASGPFPIVITYGRRDDIEQIALYAQGRTVAGRIVTQARYACHSAHGHDGAIDCEPVRSTFLSGGVESVYLGNETDPLVCAEALRRLDVYVALVRAHGLQSGRDFPGLHDDPHAQDPAWESLPLAPGVSAR